MAVAGPAPGLDHGVQPRSGPSSSNAQPPCRSLLGPGRPIAVATPPRWSRFLAKRRPVVWSCSAALGAADSRPWTPVPGHGAKRCGARPPPGLPRPRQKEPPVTCRPVSSRCGRGRASGPPNGCSLGEIRLAQPVRSLGLQGKGEPRGLILGCRCHGSRGAAADFCDRCAQVHERLRYQSRHALGLPQSSVFSVRHSVKSLNRLVA